MGYRTRTIFRKEDITNEWLQQQSFKICKEKHYQTKRNQPPQKWAEDAHYFLINLEF